MHDRKNGHRSANRGSGGVGVFVKHELRKTYNVSVLDKFKVSRIFYRLQYLLKRTVKITSYVCVILRRQIPRVKTIRSILFHTA